MSETQAKPSRRGFMWGAAVTGTATAAAVALPRIPGAAEPAPVAQKPEPPERGGGYHVSEHVKRYYKTTLV